MAKKSTADYVIARLGPAKFQVAKFGDSEQPLAVYTVEYSVESDKGKCDCQAAIYRGTGSQDKHVRMVAQWVKNGDSPTPKEKPK